MQMQGDIKMLVCHCTLGGTKACLNCSNNSEYFWYRYGQPILQKVEIIITEDTGVEECQMK